eukprot:m.29156 g.29156  ORF g.29156 m.29156 type:complete len:459 (+) comp8069_c0_seq1:86-1462(+)
MEDRQHAMSCTPEHGTKKNIKPTVLDFETYENPILHNEESDTLTPQATLNIKEETEQSCTSDLVLNQSPLVLIQEIIQCKDIAVQQTKSQLVLTILQGSHNTECVRYLTLPELEKLADVAGKSDFLRLSITNIFYFLTASKTLENGCWARCLPLVVETTSSTVYSLLCAALSAPDELCPAVTQYVFKTLFQFSLANELTRSVLTKNEIIVTCIHRGLVSRDVEVQESTLRLLLSLCQYSTADGTTDSRTWSYKDRCMRMRSGTLIILLCPFLTRAVKLRELALDILILLAMSARDDLSQLQNKEQVAWFKLQDRLMMCRDYLVAQPRAFTLSNILVDVLSIETAPISSKASIPIKTAKDHLNSPNPQLASHLSITLASAAVARMELAETQTERRRLTQHETSLQSKCEDLQATIENTSIVDRQVYREGFKRAIPIKDAVVWRLKKGSFRSRRKGRAAR